MLDISQALVEQAVGFSRVFELRVDGLLARNLVAVKAPPGYPKSKLTIYVC